MDNLPSSVSKYTHAQLAHAFVKIQNYPAILKTQIPESRRLKGEARKFANAWIYDDLNTVEGFNDLKKAMVRVMIYLSKPQVMDNTNNNNDDKVDILINATNKQIELISNLLDKTSEQSKKNELEKKLELKKAVLKELQNKKTSESNKDSLIFTNQQIGAITRRILKIMEGADNSAYSLKKEFEYVTKPKRDHVKESQGCDYVLPNSKRDRRAKYDNNWRSRKNNDNDTENNNKSYSKSNSSPLKSSKGGYVAPGLRNDKSNNSNINTDNNDNTKTKRYIAPWLKEESNNNHRERRNGNNYRNNTGRKYDNSNRTRYYAPQQNDRYDNRENNKEYNSKPESGFISINNISEKVNVDSKEHFPVLINEKPSKPVNKMLNKVTLHEINNNDIDDSNIYNIWNLDNDNEANKDNNPKVTTSKGNMWGNKNFAQIVKEKKDVPIKELPKKKPDNEKEKEVEVVCDTWEDNIDDDIGDTFQDDDDLNSILDEDDDSLDYDNWGNDNTDTYYDNYDNDEYDDDEYDDDEYDEDDY